MNKKYKTEARKANFAMHKVQCCGLRVQTQFNPQHSEAYFINPASYLLTYRSDSLWVEIYWYEMIK